MKQISLESLCKLLLNVVVAILGILLALKIYTSLGWRMEHDTPLLHYAGFLMVEYGLVPYRDIFETSLPVTYLFHYLIVWFFGVSEHAFRMVDVFLLLLLFCSTCIFMSRFGAKSAVWSCVFFGVMYLSGGQALCLQRDYVGLIPIAFCLPLIPRNKESAVGIWRFIVLGILYGLGFLVKPHLAVSAPVIFFAILFSRFGLSGFSAHDFLKCFVVSAVSFAVPLMVSLFLIYKNGALDSFYEIFFRYLPLYNDIDRNFQVRADSNRILYTIKWSLYFGGMRVFFISALFSLAVFARQTDKKSGVQLSFNVLLACLVLYGFYPAIAGKFWDYHYLPFMYFCSLALSVVFCGSAGNVRFFGFVFSRGICSVLVVFSFIYSQVFFDFSKSIYPDMTGEISHSPKNGRVDEISRFLIEHMRPGDTVQPLDITGGSIHAMLVSEARIATRFMYDEQFYHHASSDYVIGLRQEFMRAMQHAAPRFIIKVETWKPWATGPDTTREFPELDRFINENYVVAKNGDGYLIYERSGDT